MSAERWPELRYGKLLALAETSRSRGRLYAWLAGTIELVIDRGRRRLATARIARWLEVSPTAAGRIFHASLVSEAQEEADSVYFMRHPESLLNAFRTPGAEPAARGRSIYATLHFGSPILAYLYLCRGRGIDARAIGRKLDPDNRMPAAKRSFGLRKVAWVESFSGRAFLNVDSTSLLRARAHLLAGNALFAAIDVPADVVARSARGSMFGDEVALSVGMLRLAEITRSSLQPLVAIHRGTNFELHYGAPIEPLGVPSMLENVVEQISGFVRAWPREWWLWPYLTTASAV